MKIQKSILETLFYISIIILMWVVSPGKEEIICKNYDCTITKSNLFSKQVEHINIRKGINVTYSSYRSASGYYLEPISTIPYKIEWNAQRDAAKFINGNGHLTRYSFFEIIITLAMLSCLLILYIARKKHW